jgi:hypothetical protein
VVVTFAATPEPHQAPWPGPLPACRQPSRLAPCPVDLSPEHADDLQRLLGLTPRHAGRMAPADFVGRALIALAFVPAIATAAPDTAPTVGRPGGPGWPAGYYLLRLEQLHDLAIWCALHSRRIAWHST